VAWIVHRFQFASRFDGQLGAFLCARPRISNGRHIAIGPDLATVRPGTFCRRASSGRRLRPDACGVAELPGACWARAHFCKHRLEREGRRTHGAVTGSEWSPRGR
jgi:hypothetical protein